MSLFRRPHYTSDTTDFLNQLKHERPALEAEQRAGRALLWDQEIDLGAADDYQAASVAQRPYVYQTDPQQG